MQLRLSPRQTKGPRRRGGAGVFPFRHEPPRAATVARSALRAAKGGRGGLVSLTDEARPRRIPGSASRHPYSVPERELGSSASLEQTYRMPAPQMP